MDKNYQKVSTMFPAHPLNENPNPLFQLEKQILVLGRQHEKAQPIYNRFYEDLDLYSRKLPTSVAKTSVESLRRREMILLGKTNAPSKTGIIGTYLENKSKLIAIVLESSELSIDSETGITSSIDQCYFSAYFQFIRATVFLNEKTILQDISIHKLVVKYFMFMLLKLISTNVNLNEKQKTFLEIVSSYFYFRFLLNKHHEEAKEITLQPFDKSLKSEVASLMSRLEKYNEMKDIFKALIDFNISHEPPSLLIMKALTKFKSFVFYCLTTSIDYLIALSIVSKYPADFASGGLINVQLQDKIEVEVEKYFKHIQYDTASLNKL